MADLGKNGYSWSGYTEPFFVPKNLTINNGARLDSIGAIPLELTEHKNNVLYIRSDETITGTSFLSKDCTFDTRSNINKNKWVVDFDGTEASIVDIIYDNVDDVYIITVSTSVSVVDGVIYNVTKRFVDVSDITASTTYLEGDKVIELYV